MMETWLVGTGLTSEIGQALLSRLGPTCRVLAISRQPAVDPTHHLTWIPGDLANTRELWLERLVNELKSRQVAQVTGVVHAAGVVFADRVTATTQDEIDRTLTVNLRAGLRLLQGLSPWLKSGSSVVLVSSVDARMQSIDGPAAIYGAAKAGLEGLARQLAAEWGESGVRVNAVAPGVIASGMGPQAGLTERITRQVALGRLGNPEEVADAIKFLLSPQSSYITGTVIRVDGGLNLRY
ncbi:MAG: SDR family oxidoreductase [Firmicutes bacterium]|nr:SDR family oxidoreductase [Bacillota bacterium]